MPEFKLPPGFGWPTKEPSAGNRAQQQELQERQAREAIRGIRAKLSSALGPLWERKGEFQGGALGVGCGVVRLWRQTAPAFLLSLLHQVVVARNVHFPNLCYWQSGS